MSRRLGSAARSPTKRSKTCIHNQFLTFRGSFVRPTGEQMTLDEHNALFIGDDLMIICTLLSVRFVICCFTRQSNTAIIISHS
jgi:hypothetical protein